MSFNAASFEYIGGGAGGSIWRYVTADNVASQTGGTATAEYWANITAFYPNFSIADMIIAVNGATPTVSMFVCSAKNTIDNTISIVPCVTNMGNPAGFVF